MEAFDTNVLVRRCVRDDEDQYGRAQLAYFILESARRAGSLPLHTFDARLSRTEGVKLV